MAYKITVTNEKLPSNYYEIGLLSKTDAKNYNIKFKSDKVLTDSDIKNKLELITECYVESIKRVTKYNRVKVSTPDDYGVALVGRYTCLGEKIRTDTLFFPLVKKQYIEVETLANELKEFFGTDFEISVYSPRI